MDKKYLIGTSGWNFEHWRGLFYPGDLPKKQWLDFYAKNFGTVEVNFSFYRWPKPETLKKWHQGTPPGFIFTLKAPRTITHVKRLKDAGNSLKYFYGLADNLKEKMGAFLFQLPPYFKLNEEHLDRLEKFLKILKHGRDNVIEFRDKSWWNAKIYRLLEKYGACFCGVSGLEMPARLEKTAGFFYIRFHGKKYSTSYSKTELKKYIGTIKNLDVKKVYAYFDNDAVAYAVKNALELRSLLA